MWGKERPSAAGFPKEDRPLKCPAMRGLVWGELGAGGLHSPVGPALLQEGQFHLGEGRQGPALLGCLF